MTLGNKRRQKVAPNLRHPRQHQRIPRAYHSEPEAALPPHPNRPPWMGMHPTQVPLIFFDLETTGGNPQNSEVIEIAAVKEVAGVEVGRYNTLVNPRRNIPRMVRAITGIDNETVRNAPVIEKVIDEFLEFVGDGVFISHGAINDFAFVVEYARRLRGIEMKNFYVCTHLIVSNFLPNIPNKRLTGLAEYFDVEMGTAHRALADAEMTQRVFWKMFAVLEKNGFHTIEDLLKMQADNSTLIRLGSGLLARETDRSPTTPGIVYLFNASRELSYVTATSNIKRTLQTVTELGDEREFNRLLVDLTDFKFERTSHFLGALLREKRELKKLHLPIDPRKYESRAGGFVQMLLPGDLAAFLAERDDGFLRMPDQVRDEFAESGIAARGETEVIVSKGKLGAGFLLHDKPEAGGAGRATAGRDSTHEKSERARNSYAYVDWSEGSAEADANVPVRKARRIASALRTHKFQYTRVPESNDVVRVGHLHEGLGWFFGPFEQPKLVRHHFDDLVTLFPYHDDTLPMEERAENLEYVMRYLHGQLAPLKDDLERQLRSPRLLFKPFVRRVLAEKLNKVALLEALPQKITAKERPRSGLALITVNDVKEMDVFVVAGGRMQRETKLALEQTDKLKSARYFTRLFQAHHDEITHPWNPVLFTEDQCLDIELMAYWITRRKGEGEWVDFDDLSPLYDETLLD